MLDIASYLTALIDIPSPTGSETACLKWLQRSFERCGLTVQRQPVSPGRYNLLAGFAPHPDILLSTHCDTVPPHIPASVSGERIYGRGACDAKGALVAMLSALLELPETLQHRAGLLVVVGEETDSCGAKAFIGTNYPARYIINGEPTGNQLAGAQKGVLIVELYASGIAAHSGYPEAGHSAISLMVRQTALLESLDWGQSGIYGNTTYSTGIINGGTAANVIPDHARAQCCLRLAQPADQVIRLLMSNLLPGVSATLITQSDPLPLFVPPGYDSIPVAFGSDAAYYSRCYPTLMAGPGCILDAHTPHESVSIAAIIEATTLYHSLIADLATLSLDTTFATTSKQIGRPLYENNVKTEAL